MTLFAAPRYLYDGWNLLAELSVVSGPSSVVPLRTYTWGLDLSGSLQGAGGVGGLVTLTDRSTLNPQPSTHFPAFDGNGNVVGLVAASDGALSAKYDYNAFGETVLSEGTRAAGNPFRFSTKYTDSETGHLCYGYRCYDPSAGRWPSRDPIEESGGVNLYGFVGNNPITRVDLFGLDPTNTTTAASCCSTVTLIVELPNANARGKLNRKGMAGHSGVGVDSDYYDYGPQPGGGGNFGGSPGRPWWDSDKRINRSGDASLQDVLNNIDTLAPGNDVYKVTASVNQSEAATVRKYWENLYAKPGTYRFYGQQCTTTACQSLEGAHLIPNGAMKPANFLKLLRESLKNTCGPNKGQSATVEKIHSVPSPSPAPPPPPSP